MTTPAQRSGRTFSPSTPQLVSAANRILVSRTDATSAIGATVIAQPMTQ